MHRSRNITSKELLYGYDDSIRLAENGLFYVKGKDANKVVLNKIPTGVKSVEILDEHSDVLSVLSKVFTFKAHTKNLVFVTTYDDDYFYFEYRPEKGGFVEKRFFD